MSAPTTERFPVEVDGVPATADDLAYLAFHNHGHYTFMQVRNGAVRGLGLHLSRLRDNAVEVFGIAPPEGRLRELLRSAVGDRRDCSVRVVLAHRDLAGVMSGAALMPEVFVSVAPPRESSTDPLRVRTVSYQRETPQVKHRATHGLQRQTREARQAGFDDALFVGPDGGLTEGTTWNVLFHDGTQWVWPEGPSLLGVTMQLVRAAMADRGAPAISRRVTVADLPAMRAAFALNATSPDRPISEIDGNTLSEAGQVGAELRALWSSREAEPL